MKAFSGKRSEVLSHETSVAANFFPLRSVIYFYETFKYHIVPLGDKTDEQTS